MNSVLVFYAGEVLLEFDKFKEFDTWRRACIHGAPEFYNGAYVYNHDDREARHWYRMDCTPVLLNDVPKELRLLVLLLT